MTLDQVRAKKLVGAVLTLLLHFVVLFGIGLLIFASFNDKNYKHEEALAALVFLQNIGGLAFLEIRRMKRTHVEEDSDE